MALALLASASSVTAVAAGQKKKGKTSKQTAAACCQAAQVDSLSYAAGMTLTDGLMPFLKSNYGVDEAYLEDMLKGFQTTMEKGVDAKTKAYAAGEQVAYMVLERMLPNIKKEFAGSGDSINTETFTRGFVDALNKNHATMADTTAARYFETARKQAKENRNATLRKAGEDFLAANAKKEGVVTLPSGLQYKVLTKGEGEVASNDDEVTVKYEGRLIDGKVFDSSYKRGDGTTKFRPTQVIKGWTEALTMMPVGSKWELYIPYNLAYGERDMGDIPAFSALVFTVEMVGVKKKEAEAKTENATAKTAKPAATTTKKTAVSSKK